MAVVRPGVLAVTAVSSPFYGETWKWGRLELLVRYSVEVRGIRFSGISGLFHLMTGLTYLVSTTTDGPAGKTEGPQWWSWAQRLPADFCW